MTAAKYLTDFKPKQLVFGFGTCNLLTPLKLLMFVPQLEQVAQILRWETVNSLKDKVLRGCPCENGQISAFHQFR